MPTYWLGGQPTYSIQSSYSNNNQVKGATLEDLGLGCAQCLRMVLKVGERMGSGVSDQDCLIILKIILANNTPLGSQEDW